MSKSGNQPFKALPKKRFPTRREKEREARLKARAEAEERDDSPAVAPQEESLFASAMQDVKPLSGKGRDVAPSHRRKKRSGKVEDPSLAKLKGLVSGEVSFHLEYTEEYVLGHVAGLDTSILISLKAGQISHQAHLDLHGMNSMQAYVSLESFIRDHYLVGSRCVLVITGRGRNSPEGYAVLREKVQHWFTSPPMKQVVVAFCTALPRHGGAGALYVLLRKQGRNKGRIRWERLPSDLLDDTVF